MRQGLLQGMLPIRRLSCLNVVGRCLSARRRCWQSTAMRLRGRGQMMNGIWRLRGSSCCLAGVYGQ